VPELLGASAQHVARTAWPADLFRAGALCLAAAFALRLPARRGVLAAALVATDMLAANLVLNPTARRDFYELVPPLRAQVERAVANGPFRWFALSLNAVRGVRFSAWVAALNSDVIAYRMARQSMLGTSAALDGLESAFEEEDSFAPLASTLPRELRTAERFREFVPHLRLANVRWVLSLAELPPGARAVFVLHDVEGYKHEEIAALTGVAAGTSKAQLHRARLLLREALRR